MSFTIEQIVLYAVTAFVAIQQSGGLMNWLKKKFPPKVPDGTPPVVPPVIPPVIPPAPPPVVPVLPADGPLLSFLKLLLGRIIMNPMKMQEEIEAALPMAKRMFEEQQPPKGV
jgi:hypothetical protein